MQTSVQPIIRTAVAVCYIIGQALPGIVHHPHPIYYYYDNHYQDNGPMSVLRSGAPLKGPRWPLE